MTFFEESPKPTETWRKFESFLGRLLSANLVLPEAMEDQSIRLLKSDWPLVSGHHNFIFFPLNFVIFICFWPK
jgi:hypothetical protein